MNVIYKYPLKVTDRQDVELFQDCDILSIQRQNEKPYMWVMHDTSKPVMRVTIRCIGTGQPIDKQDHQLLKFISTVQSGPPPPLDIELVWHWFLELPV